MTYLAPRQGLFAIIILISFLIHTTLLLISTDQQLDELKMQTGEQMLVQLIEEVKLPLLSQDKVSLSVLTGRYTSENDIARLTIKDTDGEVLLQTGQAQLLQGDVISQQVVLNDNIIGEVTLSLRDTSNGEIIASQWLFVLGSFVTHLLIWLLYGYIARPTREQLAALSRDVQEHLISHQRIQVKRTRRGVNGGIDSNVDDDANGINEDYLESDSNDSDTPSFDIKSLVNRYVQSHQAEDSHLEENHLDDSHLDGSDDQKDTSQSKGGNRVKQGNNTLTGMVNAQKGRFKDRFTRSTSQDDDLQNAQKKQSLDDVINESGIVNDNRKPLSQSGAKSQTRTNIANKTVIGSLSPSPISADRPIDTAVVQIRFADPYNLIGTLAPEQSKPYFMLCTQLLERTVTELLKQPLLHGVAVSDMQSFDADGITVEFRAQSHHSKAGLAAMMLAKVYMMLHEITSVKLRELGRFSADIYIGVSDEAVKESMQTLIKNNGEADDIYALLPTKGIKQISGHMQLNSFSRPTTVYERDCVYLVGVSNAMMQRLAHVRNVVLLSNQ